MNYVEPLTLAESGELAYLIAQLKRRAERSPARSSAAAQARELAEQYRSGIRPAAHILREARELSRKYRDVENYIDPIQNIPKIR